MTEDARIPSGAPAYRGFLFSDVRGFTAFAERHGNSAAAAMVGRFLDIARAAIARHGGSEMATEGDAIHAVFPSASSAVMCGLEITEGATALNQREGDRPLSLGVGVHAGEAVETAEGYIGRAVNIAARLCAEAKPGEVLVSSTVKGITQSSIPVGFIPRGRRRLKGIQDPILVYAVTRDVDARARRRLPRGVLVGGGAAAAIVALIAVVVIGAQLLQPVSARATVTPAGGGPSPQTVVIGPLPIGSYAPKRFQPAFTFDITDPGWTANRDAPKVFSLIREGAPRGSLFFGLVEVIDNPCVQGAEGASGAPGPNVIATLQGLGHLELSEPAPFTIGGATGRMVDVTVSNAALATCGGLAGAEVALFDLGDEVWSASAGERFRLVSIEVGGQEVTIVMSLDWTATHSVQELEELLQRGQIVLDSVHFLTLPAASPIESPAG